MPTGHPESIVKIKESYRVIIYYRNVAYATGYTLKPDKDLTAQFKNGRLTRAWGEGWEEANRKIYEKKHLIDTLILEANREGYKPNEYINAHLNNKANKLQQDSELTSLCISELFTKFVEFKKEKNKHKKKQGGVAKYETLQKRLSEFEDCDGKNGKKQNIHKINLKWRNHFCEFLVTKREDTIEVNDGERVYKQIKKRGISNSTLNSYMYALLNFFEWVEYNYKIELDRHLKEFTPYSSPTPEENIITPTLQQWNEFKEYVPTRKSLEKTYDLALLSSYTGMRYSDCVTLSHEDIKDKSNNFLEGQEPLTIQKPDEGQEQEPEEIAIKKKAIKTGGYFEVTFNPVALAIFEKYNRDMRQKFPNDQQINKNLRQIWKTLPSWGQKVKYKVYILDKEVEEEDYFYNVASFHIFRKVFTTFLVAQNNFSTDEIMRMTGWKDERMLRHYRNVFNGRKKQIMF
jgi:integrase